MKIRSKCLAMLKNRSKSKRKSLIRYGVTLVLFLVIFCAGSPSVAHATGNRSNEGTSGNESLVNDDGFNFNITSNAGSANLESTLQILIILTILSLAPSILIMVTSFTRIIVVFHFVRTAIGTQTAPPNQVLVGLSLFITLAIMSPVMMQINDDAVQPFMNGRIQQETALERGIAPLREFMLKETRDKDLKLFVEINNQNSEDIQSVDDIPTTTIIPAFIISELRTAFIIGFLLYLPFIVMDMVVASTLMSMGMMMLPPTTISLPFKILLFVLADGWNLVVGTLVESFK
ncbi:MAG: flagellar type III secretion system pore protein FliP [Lachnospiraceae bacterium]|nr:flagellar type III secretion system pore protein FliP [Lachnospiraceae bacterium]